MCDSRGVFVFLWREEQLKQINVCGRDLRAAAATAMEIWDVVGRSVARHHPMIPRLRRQTAYHPRCSMRLPQVLQMVKCGFELLQLRRWEGGGKAGSVSSVRQSVLISREVRQDTGDDGGRQELQSGGLRRSGWLTCGGVVSSGQGSGGIGN